MLSALLLVLSMLLLGALLAKLRIFSETDADALNRYVVYAALPALVLRVVPQLRWDPSLALLVIVPWVTCLLGAVCVWLAAHALRWPRPVLGALLLCAPLGNTSFLGVPLISALRGQDAVRYALIYDQFGSFLLLSSYGLIVLARFTGDRPPTASQIARRIIAFPPFIALVVALVPWPHPAALDATLQIIGATLAPVAMFAVGLRLRFSAPPQRGALALGLTIKMLLLPACALILVRALGEPGVLADVAVLEAAMPPMLTAAAMASLAGLVPELCAALAAYGVLLALALVPLWSLVK